MAASAGNRFRISCTSQARTSFCLKSNDRLAQAEIPAEYVDIDLRSRGENRETLFIPSYCRFTNLNLTPISSYPSLHTISWNWPLQTLDATQKNTDANKALTPARQTRLTPALASVYFGNKLIGRFLSDPTNRADCASPMGYGRHLRTNLYAAVSSIGSPLVITRVCS